MTAGQEPAGVEGQGGDYKTLTAMTLRTLFSGEKGGPSTNEPTPVESVAIEWQSLGVHESTAEIHTARTGQPQGRGTELIGRVAAAGEQLGLAGTCLLEAQRWMASGKQEAQGADMAERALAEITGYYAMSAGHGLVNLTVRTLALSPACLGELKKVKRYKRASGFPPFSASPAAWLFFNKQEVETLTAAAKAADSQSVDSWIKTLDSLLNDPRWDAMAARRHEDFHRWRPQSISGGVANTNPWQNSPDGSSSLHVWGTSQYQPVDPALLVAEAEAGLEALRAMMEAWMAGWPKALKALGCAIFKTDE